MLRAIRAVLPVLMMVAPCGGAPEIDPVYESAPVPRMQSALTRKMDEVVRGGKFAVTVPCSDAVFLRRVYLDVIGKLPTAAEAEAFLADKNSGKRRSLIEDLLERPEYVEYWGMKWSEILRVKSEFPVNLWPNAAQAYDAWIRNSLRKNMPSDEFARRLITASGSNFRNPEVNFLRAAGGRDPSSLAAATARVFLGQRTAPPQWAEVFAGIRFKNTNEWKEEILTFEGGLSGFGTPSTLQMPDGSSLSLSPADDPREAFSKWLVGSPAFASNAANRLWFWIFGEGLVQEPDDFRPDNPPSHPALLAWLAKTYAESGFDTRQMLRIILNSDTYQASSIPGSTGDSEGAEHRDPNGTKLRGVWDVEAAACRLVFPGKSGGPPLPRSLNLVPFHRDPGFYSVRRVEAEVLLDAINDITGSGDEYSSLIPEPFTFLPEGTRAVSIPDGSITSSFLEILGRPPRDTGFLCERPMQVNAAQRLQLLNSGVILRKLAKSKSLTRLLKSTPKEHDVVDALYLTILSRHPSAQELDEIAAYQPPDTPSPRDKMLDVAWALLNTPEFFFKH